MTRTYWLSFCDPDKPEGQQFLGVVVIDVSEEDAAAAKPVIDVLFPRHDAGAEWIAAAQRKCWQLGCNPGGQVAAFEKPAAYEWPADVPRGRLLQRGELEALGVV
jgi:hypothetical protein